MVHAVSLRLNDQICFPLYAASRAIQQRYQPLLQPLGLTYPQYLVMLALWEEDELSVRELGARLWLDSGTLTPLLKRMAAAGLIERRQDAADRRVSRACLSEKGRALKSQAQHVPQALVGCIDPQTDIENLTALKAQLDRLLQTLAAG